LAQQASLQEPDTITIDDEDQEATRIGPPPEVREVPVVRLTPLAALEDDAPDDDASSLDAEVTKKVERARLPSALPAPLDLSDEESTTKRPRPTPQAIDIPPDIASKSAPPAPSSSKSPPRAPAPSAPPTSTGAAEARGQALKVPAWLIAAIALVCVMIAALIIKLLA
jgi:hypothetical protein